MAKRTNLLLGVLIKCFASGYVLQNPKLSHNGQVQPTGLYPGKGN